MIKIRRFNLNPIIGVICVIDVLFVANAPILLGPLVNTSGTNAQTNMAAASLLPSKVLSEPVDTYNFDTETLYVVCGSALTANRSRFDRYTGSTKFQVEHTRAQYKGIVIHVFKVQSDAYMVLDIIRWGETDIDWDEPPVPPDWDASHEFVMAKPTAARHATWGKLKSMYR